MFPWAASMHIRSEHQTEPTIKDSDGNAITFEGEATYSLTVDGETYNDLSALHVSYYLQQAGKLHNQFQ